MLLWSLAYAEGKKVYWGLNFPPGSVELLWQLPHSVCSHSSLPAPKHRSKSVPPSQVWATRHVVSGIQGDWQDHDWQTEPSSWLFVCGLNGRRIKCQLCCAAVLYSTFCFVFLIITDSFKSPCQISIDHKTHAALIDPEILCLSVLSAYYPCLFSLKLMGDVPYLCSILSVKDY